MGHKIAETTCNINSHLAQELLMNEQCSGGSRSLQRRWEPWRWGMQWLATGIWQLWIERDPFTPTWKVAEELSVDHSMVIWHLKQIETVKKLDKCISWADSKLKKKKLSIWSVIFSYSVQQQWTISQLDCDTWWKVYRIRQLAMTSSRAGQR